DKAGEIVNDVFINIWARREELRYPVYTYLQNAVKYGCLNHIRYLRSQQTFLDGYKEEIFSFQEQYILSGETPLQQVEIKELQEQIDQAINTLPEKCRIIFKKYLYEGIAPKDIATELGIHVNTVRVQIKIAFDKIRNEIGPAACLIFFYFFTK
ncbi:MAG: sigma-70 family RNA polymerase sigma factor, partial [Tannerellaceae bacterium]|nr:sigma-70 family RNA polymerase sigma factor [Tannerellaceae bacterium]